MSRKLVKSKFFFEENEQEHLAEVPDKQPERLAPNEDLNIIGKRVARVDGYDKVSGSAVYAFDVQLQNMLHARTLRCPHPNAKIKHIDVSRARKLKGVVGILTYQNAPKIRWYHNSYLFDPHLRYEGDEVACVAAETPEIAIEALSLIAVDYDILGFVVNARKALEKGAISVHESGNLVGNAPSVYQRGDIDQGFAEADATVEDTFSTPVVVHNPTEVHCSVVNWDGDQLTVWDSTQGVFSVRDAVAQSLGASENKVRIIDKFMGGGFGSKLEAGKYTVMAALLARDAGRPVSIQLDRKEMNLAVGNRPDSTQHLKVGAKKDGTLTAMHHRSIGSAGAYPSGAACSWPFRTVYQCNNVKTEDSTVYINAGRARPFRAPGHVQGTFGMDSIIDEIAEKVGMDPLEFRLKNYAEKDQVSGLPYTSKRLREAYEQGAQAIGWKNRQQKPGSQNATVKRGIGMATQIWWGGGGPPAYATLKLNRDGSARVISGTQDIGTGTYTFIAQIAAEVLEIPITNVEVTLGDTTVCPYGPSSGGSQTAPSISPAVYDAAEQMRAKLISGAAAILNIPEADLVYSKGIIGKKGSISRGIGIAEIVQKMRERVLVTTGARNANPDGYAINSFGAQFAEVEVDTMTGKVRPLKIVAAHDIGRVLNQQTLENQFHGGIMQGLSYALLEERVIDEYTGKVLTTNLHDYKIPTIMDTPEIEVIIVSDADYLISPVGSKGIGEPAIIPTAGAIANAVYNAIGVRIKSLPITPDKVIDALYTEA